MTDTCNRVDELLPRQDHKRVLPTVDVSRLPDEALIPDTEMRALLGGISAMTVWRWERRYDDFPGRYNMGGRNYRRLGDVRTFIAARRAAPLATADNDASKAVIPADRRTRELPFRPTEPGRLTTNHDPETPKARTVERQPSGP